MWPKELITMEPGETGQQVVLKKIRELSDSSEDLGPEPILELAVAHVSLASFPPLSRLVLRLWTQDRNSIAPLSAKFGARLEACEDLLRSARDLGLAVVGVSFHVGSDCQDPHNFTQAIMDSRRVLDMGRGIGHDMNLLDIGGGFPGVEGSDLKFEEMARVINAALAQHFPEESGVRVMAEPGRFYAESVFTAAVNIIAKKVVLEPGGCLKLMYYLNESHYGAFRYLRREPVPRRPIVVKELPLDPPLFPCTLYGPTCDALDMIFLEEVQLPQLDEGDWLIFPSMDAYTSAMSSTFNGFPPASVCYAMRPELRSLLETDP
ncbi:PREDICTED: antizyme inhibitor 2-like [Condylura cristata]|uniref:antizyme inhibitor 2-like n=1 Tax=Condylura cristata TaxID=143302 RepID=UPI0003342EAB|nr:PREDICTED: antizyme inhibitor 2-like [Condylura cristata]